MKMKLGLGLGLGLGEVTDLRSELFMDHSNIHGKIPLQNENEIRVSIRAKIRVTVVHKNVCKQILYAI